MDITIPSVTIQQVADAVATELEKRAGTTKCPCQRLEEKVEAQRKIIQALTDQRLELEAVIAAGVTQ